MKKNNRLPLGFVDSYSININLENDLINKFQNIFENYDYKVIQPSLIDYVENLQMEPNSGDKLFKTIDNNGKLIGVLNDITPSIMRIIEGETLPHRFFYNTKGFSFLPNENEVRTNYNVGAQIYNITGIEAEVEVISTMLQTLSEIGIINTKLTLNHFGIIKNLVTSFNPKISITLNEILLAINNKDGSKIGDVCLNMVTSIYNSKGDLKILEKVAESVNNKEALEGVVALFRIYQLLKENGRECDIVFDFGNFNADKSYYNGTIFKIEGQDLLLASGGRYFGIKYGKGFTGVACNYNMPIILEYYRQVNSTKEPKERVLLAVEDSTEALAKFFNIREILNKQEIIAVPIYKTDRKMCKEYAQIMSIDNIIYIDNKGDVSE
ncbi:MAG: ATP phosphoribosyltransferase regulatory subunit [Clostridia bacterium]